MPFKGIDTIKLALPQATRNKEWHRLGWSLPWLVLAIVWVATYQIWQSERHDAIKSMQVDFDFRVRETNTSIEQRMKAYEQILRGVRALFLASNKVSRDEFRGYIDSLHLEDNYPGSRNIGFAQAVPGARNAAVSKQAGSAKGARASIAVVSHLEPLSADNGFPLGSDLSSDPVRRTAMELARDTGQAVNSEKVLLPKEANEDARIQGGFVMFMPVYKKMHRMPPSPNAEPISSAGPMRHSA